MLKNPILFGWWEIEGKERELAISSLTLLGDALFFSFFPAISQPSGQYFFFFCPTFSQHPNAGLGVSNSCGILLSWGSLLDFTSNLFLIVAHHFCDCLTFIIIN